MVTISIHTNLFQKALASLSKGRPFNGGSWKRSVESSLFWFGLNMVSVLWETIGVSMPVTSNLQSLTSNVMIKSYKDLDVYNLSYQLAMDIFFLTKKFPKEELYSLTSQVVRSSRSISSNIVEGWAKRIYPKKFKTQLVDALGSSAETQNWISFSKDCGYISEQQFDEYSNKLDHIGKMLTKLHQNWKSPKSNSSSNL